MEKLSLLDLPAAERPRERLMVHGADAVSNAELLAIVFRTGSKTQSVVNLAKTVLKQTNGIKHLDEITFNELVKIPGIGPSKAVQLLASIELGKRVSQSIITSKLTAATVMSPKACFELLHHEMRYLKQEHFVVLSLDVKNRLIAKDTVFIGALDATLVHPREVFRTAVKRMAASIICVHNHPSGDATPSEADKYMTKQLMEASLMMDIPLIDHIIIGGNDYTSLKAYGHM